MVGGYQPLATYGALADIPVEEARFRVGVEHDDLIRAGRFGAVYIRTAPGFQSLIYLHDGQRHRVLAFWQSQEAIQRFHQEGRAELTQRERAELPDSPWITHLDSFRGGIARRHLMGPGMRLEQTDLATLSPPAVVEAYDLGGVRDADGLLACLEDLVPARGTPAILGLRGFMFFSACDFGGGDFSLYFGFRNRADYDSFRASEVASTCQQRIAELVRAQHGTLSTNAGRLLGWTVRRIS